MKEIWKVAVGLFGLVLLIGSLLVEDVLYAGGPQQPYYADY